MNRIPAVIVIVAIAAWVLAIAATIYRQDYTALNVITPVMITVAAGYFAFIRRSNGNGGK